MFAWQRGVEVPTTVEPKDVLFYSKRYRWVKFCRGHHALQLRSHDDKINLHLSSYEEFQSFCKLVARVCGLGIERMYAKKQRIRLWRCRLGESLLRLATMKAGDEIRYNAQLGELDIRRGEKSLYKSKGKLLLDMLNFSALCQILASCLSLDTGELRVETVDEYDIWSMTLES